MSLERIQCPICHRGHVVITIDAVAVMPLIRSTTEYIADDSSVQVTYHDRDRSIRCDQPGCFWELSTGTDSIPADFTHQQMNAVELIWRELGERSDLI